MITKERIEQQGGNALALDGNGHKVAVKVVGYDDDGTPLVKYRCMFGTHRVPFEKLFPIPIDDDFAEAESYNDDVVATDRDESAYKDEIGDEEDLQ